MMADGGFYGTNVFSVGQAKGGRKMRVSAQDVEETGHTYIVTLDGVDVSDKCFKADSKEGWVDCFITNENDHLVLEPKTFRPTTKRLHGDVVIEQGIDFDILEGEDDENR